MTHAVRPTPRRLDAFTLASEPGNERLALARVADSVADVGLEAARLERLKTAVAEATMNAIEHGNGNRPEIPVEVEVTQNGDEIIVAISDRGGQANAGHANAGQANAGQANAGQANAGQANAGQANAGQGDHEDPDLVKKLDGEQSPRGWGLFLIRNMVDAMDITTDGQRHTIWLTMRTGGAAHDEHV
jgi:anti-sigma regulatory factor (Ser/Thr protein kinase)